MSPSSRRHLRRPPVLTIPGIDVPQIIVHAHHRILIGDHHPSHIMLRAPFNLLLCWFPRIRCPRLPILPDEIHKASGRRVR